MGDIDNLEKRPFAWDLLGDIELGRGALGSEMPVVLYRLLQFTLMDVLSENFGLKKANSFFRDAGYIAGKEFAENAINTNLPLNEFMEHLKNTLASLKMGVLHMEHFDADSGEIILSVAEDLDCSGLPTTGEAVCVYDEGLLAGLLHVYTGKKYNVQEIDCWATGDSLCRFRGVVQD